jgi:hypothetical protein
MSFENPTRLRIGMHGNFSGKDYRLVGRVVLGETEDGETYYWNEFNLVASDGGYADLVYEETERGDEWRLFTMFDPDYPMTAGDAATKRIGDRLNLNGTDVRVTLVETSHVYRIEGKAPEGIEVGAEANYFNAEAGDIIQVVSWTGEEVEFYDGVNLSRGLVNAAFKLPQEPGGLLGLSKNFSSSSGSGSDNYTSGLKFAGQIVCVFFLFWLIFGRNMSCSANYEASAANHFAADTPSLAVGMTGKWQDKNYHITAHALVEIAQAGLIFDRHEYELTDDYAMKTTLVCGDRPNAGDWILFEQIFPLLPPPSGKGMAVKNVGDLVELDGFTGNVTKLFRSTIKQTDGDDLSPVKTGLVFYGLVATNEFNTLFARWTGDGISYYVGHGVTAKKVIASFNSPK